MHRRHPISGCSWHSVQADIILTPLTFFVILQNITRLVSQQRVYKDGKALPFPHEINPVVGKIMQTQEKLGAAQLDARSFITKSNFVLHNYCCLLSLMITNNAFVFPRTIPFKVLKVNDESQHWKWIFSRDYLNIEKAHSDFDPNIHDPLAMAIKNQSQDILTEKGMKDTLCLHLPHWVQRGLLLQFGANLFWDWLR